MAKIYKQALYAPKNIIDMPAGSGVLHVHEQHDEVMLWYECDPDKDQTETRTFILVGTGNPFENEGLTYVGTAHVHPFVWHVYEVEDGN